MPQITKITPQKNQQRFNVYIDGQFAFGVSKFTLLQKGLKEQKQVSQKVIDEVIKKEKTSKFMDLANNFLSVRPRSEKELKDYLTRKISQIEQVKFHEAAGSPIIERVVKTLKRYGYIDDKSFAKWFVKSRLNSNKKSVRLIKLELKRKGVPSQLIESLKFPASQDKKSAVSLVQKKVERWQKLKPLEYKKKFYAYLLSRGFEYDTINDAFAFYKEKR